jgi:tetratricopeptide (TPR) repeat protein
LIAEGNLAETSLAVVMRSISDSGKTGVLDVTNGPNVGMFFFEDGKLCSVETDQVKEGLGERLVKSGWISEDQLAEALRLEHAERDKKIPSEILAGMDVVHPPILKSHIIDLLEEVLSVMLTWPEGSYVFDPFPWPAHEKATVSVDVDQVLTGAVRKLVRIEDMKRILPEGSTVLEPAEKKRKGGYLNAEERDVLFMIDGNSTIDELAAARDEDAESTLRPLCVLYVTGYVVEKGGSAPEAVEREPKREEHVEMGIAFLEMKMYEEAIREFKRALELEPDSVEARFYLSIACYRSNRLAEAAGYLLKLAEIMPEKGAILNNLGLVHEKLGDFDNARDFYWKSAQAGDSGSTPLVNIGIASYKMGLYEDAEKALKAAKDMGTKSSLCTFYLGILYARKGEHDGAEEMFNESIELNPDAAPALNNLAAVYELKGQFDKAEEWYRMAIETDPNYETARGNLKVFGG